MFGTDEQIEVTRDAWYNLKIHVRNRARKKVKFDENTDIKQTGKMTQQVEFELIYAFHRSTSFVLLKIFNWCTDYRLLCFESKDRFIKDTYIQNVLYSKLGFSCHSGLQERYETFKLPAQIHSLAEIENIGSEQII